MRVGRRGSADLALVIYTALFLLLLSNLFGWLMPFLAFFGWLAVSRLPVLSNILPARLMLLFYLLAGLALAGWLATRGLSSYWRSVRRGCRLASAAWRER